MAAYQPEVEVESFHRLVSLIIDVDSSVLRKLLMKHVLNQTISLDKHLVNHKTKLEDLMKNKKILNQCQMDMLYPTSGVAKIEEFDITLIVCLLRNTCTLPHQELHEIDNLRKLRNQVYGHMARECVDDHTFKSLWEQIKNVLIKLSNGACSTSNVYVKETIKDIQTLWVNPPIRSAIRIMAQWYQSDQEILEQLESLRHANDVLKSIMKRMLTGQHSDSSFQSLKKTSMTFLLSKTSQQYVQTTLMQQAEQILQDEGSVVISGNAGEGKTLTGATITMRNTDPEKCLVLTHPQEWRMVDINVVNVIFIDDIFGIFQLEDGILTEWLHVLDKISASVEQGKIKVVIATKSNILQECFHEVSRFSVFKNVIQLSSSKLLEKEKIEILTLSLTLHEKEMDPHEIEACVKGFTSPMGFPICCSLFCTDVELFDLKDNFFRKPHRFFARSLIILDKEKKESLMYLLYKGGSLDIDETTGDSEQGMSKVLQNLSIDNKLEAKVIQRSLEQMEGIYVLKSENSFRFVHNTVPEALCLLYGKSNPQAILSVCPSDFLHQCVVVERQESSRIDENHSSTLVIQPQLYTVLAKRLASEIIDRREVIITACHSAYQYLPFVETFVETIRELKLTRSFFQAGDRLGGENCSFLPEYIQRSRPTEQEKIVKAFVHCLGNCKHLFKYRQKKCWKCKILNLAMDASCLSGRICLSFELLEKGAMINLEKAVEGRNVELVNSLIQEMEKCGTWNPHTMLDSLNISSKHGDAEICSLLLIHGVLPRPMALELAVEKGNAGVVKLLLEKMIFEGSLTTRHAQHCLNVSCRAGRLKTSLFLLGKGILPSKETILCAVESGNKSIVKDIILRMKSFGSLKRETMVECLNKSCLNKDLPICKLLIEHGVNPDQHTMIQSVRGDNCDIVDMILEKIKSSGKLENKHLVDCLNISCRQSNAKICCILMDNGGIPSEETLEIAVETGDGEVLRVLLEQLKKLKIHKHNCLYKCLNRGCKERKVEVCKLLMEYGVIPQKETLQNAITAGNANVVLGVIEKMKALNIWDDQCIPMVQCLNECCKQRKLDLCLLLIAHGGVASTPETLELLMNGLSFQTNNVSFDQGMGYVVNPCEVELARTITQNIEKQGKWNFKRINGVLCKNTESADIKSLARLIRHRDKTTWSRAADKWCFVIQTQMHIVEEMIEQLINGETEEFINLNTYLDCPKYGPLELHIMILEYESSPSENVLCFAIARKFSVLEEIANNSFETKLLNEGWKISENSQTMAFRSSVPAFTMTKPLFEALWGL